VTIAPATVQGRQKKIIENQHVEKGFTGLLTLLFRPESQASLSLIPDLGDTHHGIIIILSVKIIS
jgi:hypothetical protein